MSGIMNLPDDEMNPKTKLKAATNNPQRTVPGRIGEPKPIPANQRTTQPTGQPTKKAAPNRSTQPTGKPSFPIGGKRSTPEDEDNPTRKAILKRLRMKRDAQ